MDKNQGYEIIKAVMLENGRGFALGHHPTAPSPYVTWACYDDKDGRRQYEWGHYGSDRAALEQDLTAVSYTHLEQGVVSSLALGYNGIEIQRGMTTSSTAIFIPFMTRELRMDGQALYYGMNALSNNVIMADRKKLKSANGMYLGSTGSGKSFAAKRELINVFLATNDRIIRCV